MPIATLLPFIIQGIQTAIQEAPNAIKVAEEAKTFFTGLFNQGLIDKATQDKCFAHTEAWVTAAANGTLGPEFSVEPA